MENLTISECKAGQSGGGVYSSAVLSMTDVSISDCYATQSGGGIWQKDKKLTLSGSSCIETCYAKQGGGIYSLHNLDLISEGKNGTAIKDCEARDVTITRSDDTVTGTLTEGFNEENLGGAVYQNAATLNIYSDLGTKIENCKAYSGGGIYSNGNCTVNLGENSKTSFVVISACEAVYGGGIYQNGEANNGTVNYRNASVIENCIASAGGGGVYLNAGTFYLYDTASITGCEARSAENIYSDTNLGGAIYQNGGTLNLWGNTGGKIESCRAYDGGGVYQKGGTLTLGDTNNLRKGTVLSGCTAEHNGAGIYVANGSDANNPVQMNMSYGTITNNVASVEGGGIAVGGENV